MASLLITKFLEEPLYRMLSDKRYVALQVVVDRSPDKKPPETHWDVISLARMLTTLVDNPVTTPSSRPGKSSFKGCMLMNASCRVLWNAPGRRSPSYPGVKESIEARRQNSSQSRPDQIKAARKRKTLVVCSPCYTIIHQGKRKDRYKGNRK